MKKSYMILGLIGVGGVGYMLWKKYQDSMSGSQQGSTPYEAPNAAYVENKTAGGQPSEKYPVQAIQPPRVDNADQPWYSGPRNLAVPQSANISNLQGPASDIANAASIVDGLSDLWNNLGMSDMFQSGGDSFSVDDQSFDWNMFQWDF